MVVDPVNQRFKAIGPSTDQATDLLIRWVNYTGIRWSVEKNKKTIWPSVDLAARRTTTERRQC